MFTLFFNLSLAAYFLSLFFYAVSLFFSNKLLPYLGRFFIICATHNLTFYLLKRWYLAGRPPLSNMFESLVVFSWAIALVLILIDVRYKIKSICALASLMGLSALGYASLLDKTVAPLLPVLRSNWLAIHVFTCFIGYAGLTVAFVASAISLCKQRGANENLDRISYKMVGFGFLFLTIGITSGSVWANSAWGSYWSWDPKETWALITWIIYAIYLHSRLRAAWKGRRAAWISVIGFLVMLFTYFGVNYLLPGLHSYASS